MHDKPELSAVDAAYLATEGPWGDGKFALIDPAEIEYGTSLNELIGSVGDMNELLEAAAVAGRLGFCDTGIALALRAEHLSVVAEADREVDVAQR